MIIILVVVLALSRLEQEVSSHHLEDCASKTPDIRRGIVIGSNYNLWGTILSSLNFWREMVISPASISHVADLDLNIISNSWASLELFFFFCLFFLFFFYLLLIFCFSFNTIKKSIKLLFLFLPVSCLASSIISFWLFLAFNFIICFWICTNCNVLNLNLLEFRLLAIIIILSFFCVNHATLACF